jgi:hypothetical protein
LENDYPDAPGSLPLKHLKDVLGSSKSSNNQVAVPPKRQEETNDIAKINSQAEEKGIASIESSDSASEIEDHANENTEIEDHNSNQKKEVPGKGKEEDDTGVTDVQSVEPKPLIVKFNLKKKSTQPIKPTKKKAEKVLTEGNDLPGCQPT